MLVSGVLGRTLVDTSGPSSMLLFCNLVYIHIQVKGQLKGVVLFTYVQFPGYKKKKLEGSWAGTLIPD